MNKVYFGKYIPASSFIHSLNPLVKLISIAILSSLFIVENDNYKVTIYGYIIFIVTILLSSISFQAVYQSIRPFRFFIIFIFLSRIFFDINGSFTTNITNENILLGLLTSLQFMLIILFSAVITFTTTQTDITKSLYFFVRPLKIFKVNTNNIAISLLIAVRFIPLIFEESSKILTAQKLRGLYKKESSFIAKLKHIAGLDSFIVPLFMRIFYYADNLSITLHYRENMDSVLKLNKISIKDTLYFFIIIILTGAGFVLL